jgi:hypothetical protein
MREVNSEVNSRGFGLGWESNPTNSFLAKLDKFKERKISLPKSKVVGKGTYKYKYAPLEKILPKIKPVLRECGLSYCSFLEGDHLVTIVSESKGGAISGRLCCVTPINSEWTIGNQNPLQVIGSSITYLRRYHLTVLLDLITEEDSDGGSNATERPDFFKTFKGLVDNKKPLATIKKMFEKNKHLFTEEETTKIFYLIKEYGNK